MSDTLLRAYALLVDAMRQPRKKSDLENAVRGAVLAVRAAILETGTDPDAAWVIRGPLITTSFPDVLQITTERDSADDSQFFIAHDDGVVGLSNGERVATY